MDLLQVASNDFVYFEADTSVAEAEQILDELRASYVIVYWPSESLYYLVPAEEVRRTIRRSGSDTTLQEALGLATQTPTPVFEGTASANRVEERGIVLTDGHLIGFYDAEQPPQPTPPRLESFGTGATRGVEEPAAEDVKRSLLAEFPEEVPIGETASLEVSLTSEEIDTATATAAILQPIGTVLNIVVRPRRGFRIIGPSEGQLTVTEQTETAPIQFKLEAKDLGPGDIRVRVYKEGIMLAELKLTPIVVEAPRAPATSNFVLHRQEISSVNLVPPDLSLVINEEALANGRRGISLEFTASDPELELYLKEFGPLEFTSDPGLYFENFYSDIENYSLSTPEEKEIAMRELEGKGAFLFTSLFPPEAQQLLWTIKDRIKTIFIQSREPWIPWELCRLSGREDGRVVEGGFFAEAFGITRWIPGIGLKPSLKLEKMAVVVPSDSGLTFAQDELRYVQSLASAKRSVTRIPARYLDLFRAFEQGEYDAWHFSGHGATRGTDPDHGVMLLEDRQQLTPQRMSGVVTNLGRTKPLIFLNACQIGKSGMSLTDIGGWAQKFISVGAGAFVGAYWSVYDRPAFQFAQELYNRLLAGIPMGEAVRQARLAIRTPGDPTWLAYTVFAHPLAQVRT